MTKELRFSERVESALRELAGLPWDTNPFGEKALVRCEGACPVAAVAEATTGEPCDVITAISSRRVLRLIGWTQDERDAVRFAADGPEHPRRPRLLELLGVKP